MRKINSKIERIANNLTQELFANKKEELHISLRGAVRKVRIVIHPVYIKRTNGESKPLTLCAGERFWKPFYNLSEIKASLNNPVEFRLERPNDRCSFERLSITKEQAVEILRSLSESEYKYSYGPREPNKQLWMGDDKNVDIYGKWIDINRGRVQVYIKLYLDDNKVFVISFHEPDKPF